MARAAADPRARQSRAGDPARGGARRCGRDAIIATGRSDYPNQVNNVLCFPFIFRGALDVGATTINERDGARRGARDRRARAGRAVATSWRTPTAARRCSFGPEYLIPKPFDPRLIVQIAPAVAQGGDGQRRRARGRSPTSTPIAQQLHAVRLPLRPDHEAGVRRGEGGAAARRLRRRRGRARAARGADRGRRRPRAADR